MLKRFSYFGGATASASFAHYYYSLETVKHEIYQFENLGEKKRAVVIGGGIAGVCSANSLKNRGYEVVLLEKNEKDCGEECSKVSAGGMQLMNGTVDKSTFFTTMKQMLLPASKSKFFYLDLFQCISDPLWWRWILSFTKSSFVPNHKQREEMLEMTCETVEETKQAFRANKQLAHEAGYSEEGAIKVLKTKEEAAHFKANPQWNGNAREKSYYADSQQLKELLPWLPDELGAFGAVVQPECARGCSEVFTKHFAKNLKVLNGITVENAVIEKGNVVELQTNQGTLVVPKDTVVVFATGSWSSLLLPKLLNCYCPVYPLKGYDVMIPVKGEVKNFPKQMVAVDRTYFTPLASEFRICGIGEFAGFDTKPSPKIESMVRAVAKDVLKDLPELYGLIDDSPVHCGLRPLVSDNSLIFGKIEGFGNVYCNVGPGQNGWKIGYGVGELLADVIEGGNHPYPTLSPDGRIKYSPIFSQLLKWRHGL